MRSRFPIFRVLALATIVACQAYGPTYPGYGGGGGGGGGGGSGGGNGVTVNDNSFDPTASVVAVGETVTWTWAGDSVHNVTFADGNGTSPDQTTGTFQRTFPVAGQFPYTCTLHQGMVGVVTVQ